MAEEKYTEKLNALKEELTAKIPTDLSEEDAVAWLAGDASELDDQLAVYMLLLQGTPAKLAEHEELVDELIENTALLKDMLIADGPKEGNFGNAMKIYKDIQEARTSSSGEYDVLDKLAIAVAVEHADPLMENDTAQWGAKDKDKTVDPVKRYLSYEKAYLDGELDDKFHLITDAWHLRMVVDGDEPDAIAAWGRSMCRNWRPDAMFGKPDQWKYVNLVRTDVEYGNGRLDQDKPELNFYQNILMNGGICGRRAWFGRFMLRAFGIPTTARPSKGHAALIHWTNAGWVCCLGPGWGQGWTKTMYKSDLDFKDSATARLAAPETFVQVQRARWIGDLMEEPHKIYGEKEAAKKPNEGKLGFWYGAAIQAQKAIVDAVPPPSEEEECPAGPVTTIVQRMLSEKVPSKKTKEIIYNDDGSIVIPAHAYTNKGKVKHLAVMASLRPEGGHQCFMSSFKPEGKTLLRGGDWKCHPLKCRSGVRMLSAGYGAYENWGFRVALSHDAADGNPADTRTLELPGGVELEMVYIQPGKFIMGGDRTNEGRFVVVEVPKHEVEITKGFYLGKYPVTQAQYKAVMGGNPSRSTRQPDCPVDKITIEMAEEFCSTFSENAGGEVRLPTEAEWEYACRAGTDTEFFFGDDEAGMEEYGWYKFNSDGKSHPVGLKKPNPWGLYDMVGNVSERISDVYQKDYYANSPKKDPTGPSPGIGADMEFAFNVEKGGKYTLTALVCTMHEHQRLMVAVHDEEQLIDLPFTCGNWGEATVEVELDDGENELHFWRDEPPQYGVAVKSFTLTPA